MNRFAYARPRSFEEAGRLVTDGSFSDPVIKAGGLDLLDHMKEGLREPDLLINIKPLSTGAVRNSISLTGSGGEGEQLRIEATTVLADIAASSIVAERTPGLAQAAGSVASPQVRNTATIAGNLLQRPRCWYYRQQQFACNKKGGDMCFARWGENKFHAIFGFGPCVIVHPSSVAPALWVLDARLHVIGGDRESVPITDLFHMPAEGLLDEHNLARGEIVTHITVSTSRFSGFYEIAERQAFDWPLVTAAASLEMEGSRIRAARICAGAVAAVPWPLPAVEKAMAGIDVDDDRELRRTCERAANNARPLSENGFKVKLLPVAVRRAVLRAAGRKVEDDR